MKLLALETSCDDTCAAVVDGRRVLSSVVSSQAALHERYGGVVPEVAARNHIELIGPAVDAALDDSRSRLEQIDAVAVTRGPGLISALLVGLTTAKAIAATRRLPLIASGGHTLLAGARKPGSPQDGDSSDAGEPPFDVLGETLDDAAGEALDKAARLLGLGYPGGPAIEHAAADGDPAAFELPVAMSHDPGLDFSFSGLKTALVYAVRGLGQAELERRRADLAASFQFAVVSQLVAKLDRALRSGDWNAVALGGGVAANSVLRRRVAKLCGELSIRLKLVGPELCTDNAAMIAAAATQLQPSPFPEYLAYDAFATGEPGGAEGRFERTR